MCKAGCPRNITEQDIADTPELASGFCNWCRPDQIPEHLREYRTPTFWMRKSSVTDEQKGKP